MHKQLVRFAKKAFFSNLLFSLFLLFGIILFAVFWHISSFSNKSLLFHLSVVHAKVYMIEWVNGKSWKMSLNANIAPWSSQWFEEISVALIWLALIWLALIWLALIWLTLIWLTLIWVTFLSKFLLFLLNIHNLGTHLAHTQMEQIWPNGTFIHYFTIISTYQPKELPSIHFLIFYEKWLFNPNFTPT